MTRPPCPSWCVADHRREDERGEVRHRSATYAVPVALEGGGGAGPHGAELLVEVSRRHGEAGAWLYLGDGWTGFSMPLESAARVTEALVAVLRATGTLEAEGL